MSAVLPPTFRLPLEMPARQGPLIDFENAQARRRGTSLAVVAGLHVLVGWALASGLARDVVEVIRKPIQMSIIPEVAPRPPPPPPPPPRVEKTRKLPKVQAPPPPSFVPPPEIVPVAPPPEPVITAVQAEPPKEPVVIEAPPPPAPPPPPAVVKREISFACPGYQGVLERVLGEAFDRVGIAGTVRTLIKVRGSQVIDSVPLSGPNQYYKYIQGAIKQMKCSAGGANEVQVTLDVVFSR